MGVLTCPSWGSLCQISRRAENFEATFSLHAAGILIFKFYKPFLGILPLDTSFSFRHLAPHAGPIISHFEIQVHCSGTALSGIVQSSKHFSRPPPRVLELLNKKMGSTASNSGFLP